MNKRDVFNRLFAGITVMAVIGILIGNLIIRASTISPLAVSTEQFITPDGTVYDLRDDKNKTIWLRRISSDGRLLAHIPFVKPVGSGYIRRNIVDVVDGEVYLYELSYESASYKTLSETITAYDMKNGRSREVCAEPAAEPGAEESHVSKRIWDGKLFLGYLWNGDQLEVTRLDVSTGMAEVYRQVTLPFILTYFHVTEEGDILAASPDSKIWLYDGEWRVIFEANEWDAMAHISIGADGSAYVLVNGHDGIGRLYKKAPTDEAFEMTRILDSEIITYEASDDATWIATTAKLDTHQRGFKVSTAGRSQSFARLDSPIRLIWTPFLLLQIVAEILVVVLLILLARHICLRGRMRLIEKQILVALPTFAAGACLLYWMVSGQIKEKMYGNTYDELLLQASEIAENIDSALLAGIDWCDPLDDRYYLDLREQFNDHSMNHSLQWSSPMSIEPGETQFYSNYWLYRVDNGSQTRVAICDNLYVNLEARFIDMDERYRLIDLIVERRQPARGKTYDYDSTGADGYWLNVLYPVFDGGALIGLIEVGKPSHWVDAAVNDIMGNIFVVMVFVLGMSLLANIAVLNFFLRALNRLMRGAQAFSNGYYDTRVRIMSTDETAEIAEAFNHMADSVEKSDQHIRAMSESYSHFVPGEMLTILGKQSIFEVEPGSYADFTATYLLLYTESFDHYRDKAFFNALNRFYACVIPQLSSAGGIIERYAGRGLAAVFDSPPEAALNALIELFAALDRLNSDGVLREFPPVECQALLSFSDSLLGVIGHDERLNMIAISRMTYESERIGEMCKRWGCRVILTQNTYDGLGGAVSGYRHRLLGYLDDHGESILVYDFYDSETPERMRERDETKVVFEEAVRFYYQNDYAAARRLFIEVIKKSPYDLAAREYLKESHNRMETGRSPGFLLRI